MLSIKKISLITSLALVAGIFTPLSANAQQLIKVETLNGKALYYREYSDQTLLTSGCEPGIYRKMVADYLQKRGAAHVAEHLIRGDQQARQTPGSAPIAGAGGASGGANGGGGALGAAQSCFEQASSQILNSGKQVAGIFGAISGGIDANSLFNSLATSVVNGACQEINSVLGKATGSVQGVISGVTQPITSTISSANGQLASLGISGGISGGIAGGTANTNLISGGGIGGVIAPAQVLTTQNASTMLCSLVGFGCASSTPVDRP